MFLPFQNGTVQCEAIVCPPLECPDGFIAAYVAGECCKKCQREYPHTQTPPTSSSMHSSTPCCQSCLFLPSHSHIRAHTHRSKRYYSRAFHLTPPQGCLTTDHISPLLSYMLTVSPEVSSCTYTYPNKLFTSRQ